MAEKRWSYTKRGARHSIDRYNDADNGGIETIREIKKINPKAKVVAITAYASSKGEKAVEAGADYILKKPFTRKEVIRVVEEMTKG